MKVKKVLKSAMLCLFIFVNIASAQDDDVTIINDRLKVIEIGKDAYRVDHRFPWSANSLLVRVGEKDFVLCDTPIENTGSQALVEWMRNKYGDINLTVTATFTSIASAETIIW